jgi:hypothetical protein
MGILAVHKKEKAISHTLLMPDHKLFFLLLGCKPAGRNTEQHDVFFGIAPSLNGLRTQIKDFWPEANEKIHIDSWRELSSVEGYRVTVVPKGKTLPGPKLFFLNLGGYKPNDLEEYHYKLFSVADNKGEAVQQAKRTAFYLHTGFDGATSHIDDRYGVDVDDVYEIADILPTAIKDQFSLLIEKATGELKEDELHIGYLKLSTLA